MKFIMRYKGAEYYYTDKWVFAKKGRELTKLAVFDQHLYKLRMYAKVPILEIDGLRMHLVRDFKTPLDYAKAVVKELDLRRNDKVLDTCMGLGYTAIEASKVAERVVTCEYNAAVVALARWNPWSDKLFGGSGIEMLQGDVADKIKGMEDKTFDAVIHDPPRFSLAPQLYSLDFYRELNRVCKKNAKLFHYFGSVGENKGRNIGSEVVNRLKQAGFKDFKMHERTQGVFFRK